MSEEIKATDHNGEDFDEVASSLRSSHELAVADERYARADVRAVELIRDAIATIENDDPDTQNAIDNIFAILEPKLNGIVGDAEGDTDAVAETVAEAAAHFADNRDLYKDTALKDAVAAGHNIEYEKPKTDNEVTRWVGGPDSATGASIGLDEEGNEVEWRFPDESEA